MHAHQPQCADKRGHHSAAAPTTPTTTASSASRRRIWAWDAPRTRRSACSQLRCQMSPAGKRQRHGKRDSSCQKQEQHARIQRVTRTPRSRALRCCTNRGGACYPRLEVVRALDHRGVGRLGSAARSWTNRTCSCVRTESGRTLACGSNSRCHWSLGSSNTLSGGACGAALAGTPTA